MTVLYHTGFQIIEKPDLRIGRKNADFGQGFYLSDNKEFAKRWARQRKGLTTYLNIYELDLQGLQIKHFSRDSEWFEYIYANRANRKDLFADHDVIIGPIANDTIYDTWGIITSGLLKGEDALNLLRIGKVYEQTVLKTEKAAASLHFIEAQEIAGEEIARYRETVRNEEESFQAEFLKRLEEMTG